MTKFQIVSDLHIEYRNNEIPDPLSLITPTSEILILAGDIGSLYKIKQLQGFLEQLCVHFKTVLYVPGNHEYYMVPNDNSYEPLSMQSLTNRLYYLEKNIPNLYILNQSSVIINNICITGCTLWSKAEVCIPKFIVRIHGMTNYIYEQRYINDLNWCGISHGQNLSEEFMIEHADKLNWVAISRCQYLSKSFIKKFKHKLNMTIVRFRIDELGYAN